jgi:hypothetical protein
MNYILSQDGEYVKMGGSEVEYTGFFYMEA